MSVIEHDLRDFEQFVRDRVEDQSNELVLEDYVCLWRARRELDETRAAIQEGLDDLAAGRVRPAAEVMSELRQRLA
ncbi:MAG TPA: hypothetical protein VK137_15760 [Planctomycetaceae bacterium]|nr:hypothetical protein [Planctomycetaceae bacterium]